MKEKYIKSPINYSGGKFRLMKKGLMDLFPQNIDTFVDLFAGACTIGVNADANRIICNDYINYLPKLFNIWKTKSIEEINEYIDDKIQEYGLSSEHLDAFLKFRNHYNETRNVEDLFILICYSFNYQMRFNNKHEYNSSFGKTAATMNDSIRNNINNFVELIHSKNIEFVCNDFREIDLSGLRKEDFVYCDPPYSISGAVYQDGKRGFKGWSDEDDHDLFHLLDDLNFKGVRFALSNMTESKGNINETLLEWSKKYNVHYFNVNYNHGVRDQSVKTKDVEVLITNY